MRHRAGLIVLIALLFGLLPSQSAALAPGWMRVGNITPAHLAIHDDDTRSR